MSQHTIHSTQFIAHPIEEVFDFFARPGNLGRITPPGMDFELLTTDTSMRAGLMIDYRIRPLLGIPTRWRTEISDLRAAGTIHRSPGARPVSPLGTRATRSGPFAGGRS